MIIHINDFITLNKSLMNDLLTLVTTHNNPFIAYALLKCGIRALTEYLRLVLSDAQWNCKNYYLILIITIATFQYYYLFHCCCFHHCYYYYVHLYIQNNFYNHTDAATTIFYHCLQLIQRLLTQPIIRVTCYYLTETQSMVTKESKPRWWKNGTDKQKIGITLEIMQSSIGFLLFIFFI